MDGLKAAQNDQRDSSEIEIQTATMVNKGRIAVYALALAQRRSEPLTIAFERFAIGVLGICFFSAALDQLLDLSNSLTEWIRHLGDPEALSQVLLDAYSNAASGPGVDGINLGEVIRQIWRSGVWAVAKSVFVERWRTV